MKPPTTSDAALLLLTWYDRHARALPWRARPGERADPYRVWLSEIMLQQTVVKAAIPYFLAFTERWPDIAALAAAKDEEIMAAWAGLGYYSRARKLIACARDIVGRHDGVFPCDETALLQLPGIGPYTAAAIAAIAFDAPAVVVDGNVERVISRFFRIEEALPAAKKIIRETAGTLTPNKRPGDYAQAVMDLGATLCTPRKPACSLCPWTQLCASAHRSDAETFPRKAAKPERPVRRGVVFLVLRGDEVLLARRPDKGLFGGMAVLPGAAWMGGRKAMPEDALPAGLAWRPVEGEVNHVFTHFALELSIHHASAPAGTPPPQGMYWWPIERLGDAGLPGLMRKVVTLPPVMALLQGASPSRKAS